MAGNRWIRLDIDYFTNPKAIAAGVNGRLLHLASICWCGQQLTDGHIPAAAVGAIGQLAGLGPRATAVATQRLVVSGLWERTEHDFYVHDFLEANRSRGQIEAERERWKLNAKTRRRGSPRDG
jgi:hypothetical protein